MIQYFLYLAWIAVGAIPGASKVVNFYDVISSFVNGIQRTTEVKVTHIVYSWSLCITVAFAFVRLENSQMSIRDYVIFFLNQ